MLRTTANTSHDPPRRRDGHRQIREPEAVRARVFITADSTELQVKLKNGEVLKGTLSGSKYDGFGLLIQGEETPNRHGAPSYRRWISYQSVAELTGADVARTTPSADLINQLRIGDKVRVETLSRPILEGKIEDLDREQIRIDDESLRFEEEELMRIDAQRNDSLLNGTLIGFGVGAGITAGLVAMTCSQGCDLEGAPQAILFMGAVGAGIGALLDALRKQRVTLYASSRADETLTVLPILTVDRKGVLFRFSF